MRRIMTGIGIAVLLSSCTLTGNDKQSDSGMSEEAYAQYKEVLAQVQTIERKLDEAEADETVTMAREDAITLYSLSDELRYEFDPMGMDSASQAACRQLQQRLQTLRPRLHTLVNRALPNIETDVCHDDDHLVEKTTVYPVYLKKGDILRIDITTERPATVNICNADAHSTVKTLSGKNSYQYELPIPNSAIYLVELNPGKTAQYASVHIRYTSGSMERLQHPVEVRSETVEAVQGDWRATAVKGVAMRNLLEEPRKFTLRGQIKAAFSGSARALVALQVPAGATDVLYSLRVATNETDSRKDGKFYDDMCTSYKRIKFMGLPLYDRQGGSGLLSTLLGLNQPVREEDAYINMYVFYNAQTAKKFQDGTPAKNLTYSVDYSTLGTQSCNGRIPSKGNRTIYLGFENERMRYNNYIWLEAISAVPHTEYFKEKYTVVE